MWGDFKTQGKIQPMWAEIQPMWAEIQPMWAEIQPMWGNLMWDEIQPMQGNFMQFWYSTHGRWLYARLDSTHVRSLYVKWDLTYARWIYTRFQNINQWIIPLVTHYFQAFWTSLAESVEHLCCHMLQGSGTPDPGVEAHQCLYASMWIKIAQPPCWPPRG